MVSSSRSQPAQHADDDEIPDWANRLVKFGSKFAQLDHNGRTDITVLLVPTRSFAAVLLAVGMVLENLLTRIVSTDQHFNRLCSLPIGTLLENELREGTIAGVDSVSGHLLLQITKPKRAQTLSKFPCHESIEKWLPKNSLRPKLGSLADRLAKHLVSESDRWFVSAETQSTVIICGERKELFSEINAPLLKNGDSLDQLLLANQYQHQTELRRTLIESRRTRSNAFTNPTEYLVIYDGGRAFLNRAGDFRGTNQLLVLEYGDADLTEVLEQVGTIWLDRVEDDDLHTVRFPTPPAGCEFAHFQATL
jgi:hypothetical protein